MSGTNRSERMELLPMSGRSERWSEDRERAFDSYPDNPQEALLDDEGNPAHEPILRLNAPRRSRRRGFRPIQVRGGFAIILVILLVLSGIIFFAGFFLEKEAGRPTHRPRPGTSLPRPQEPATGPDHYIEDAPIPDPDYGPEEEGAERPYYSSDLVDTTATSTMAIESTPIAGALVADFSDIKMRILPMGDSITFGFGAPSGNGYRDHLYQALIASNNEVEMVGGVEAGNMTQPFCDGYFGKIISYIAEQAKRSLEWKPNVVLLHAGTNDCNSQVGQTLAEAPARLGMLIDQIHAACEDAAILVAQIIPAVNLTLDANIQEFNEGVADVVDERANKGMHVQLVDLYTPFSTDYLSAPTSSHDFLDKIHPNRRGYQIMAQSWLGGLSAVVEKGWIEDPIPMDISDLTYQGRRKLCLNKPEWIHEGIIFEGGLLGQSLYSGPKCGINPVNGGLCECIHEDGSKQDIIPLFETCDTIGFDLIRTIRFADVTGDGKADLIHLHKDGAFSVFVNKDNGFHFLDFGAAPERSRTEWTQFGDINGDGLADFLVVRANGAVDAWLTHFKDEKLSFHWFDRIFEPLEYPGPGIQFWDMNGDQLVDLNYIYPDGVILTRINGGATLNGIKWLPEQYTSTRELGSRRGTLLGDISGDAWSDHIVVDRKTGDIDYRKSLSETAKWALFERVFNGTDRVPNGENLMFADITGDGRMDLLHVDPNNSAVTMWKNGCVYEKGRAVLYSEDVEDNE